MFTYIYEYIYIEYIYAPTNSMVIGSSELFTNRLESGARLKATDSRSLPMPVKVALRTRDKIAQTQDELQKWIKILNSGLDTEHWRILDKQSEPNSRRLLLLIDLDSLTAIKRTGYKIFTGLSQ
jgi:hypothetical protein